MNPAQVHSETSVLTGRNKDRCSPMDEDNVCWVLPYKVELAYYVLCTGHFHQGSTRVKLVRFRLFEVSKASSKDLAKSPPPSKTRSTHHTTHQ
jgi:hypothetical protein